MQIGGDGLMLNENQMAVVESTASNILCLAGAGTGKTHCMLERIRYLISEQDVDPRSMLVLTFTNAAACEMLYRYKVSAGAMHSIAMPTFNTFHAFCYNLIQTDADILHDIGYSTIPDIADDVQIKHVFQETVLLTGIKLSMDKMLHPVTARERADAKILTKAFFNALVKQNIITFDYLCLSVCNLFKKNLDIVRKYKDRYKYIFVDEYQDTDDIQHSFVMSFTDSNIFIVGDVLQCQPAGTKITMANMSEKLIEDVSPGDFVLTYNTKEGRYIKNLNKLSGNLNRYTKRVLAVSKHFAENVVKVSSANYSSCYTKDHITYARVHYSGNENSYVTYLMSNKQGWWRVGSTKLFLSSQGSAFGPRLRLKSEHGDRIWILGVYKNVTDAWMNEQLVAYKFGIPQVTWEHNNVKFDLSDIELLYKKLGDMTAKAKACLSEYGRDILYPIFTEGDLFNHFSKLHMFQIRVGNLIPGIFDLVYPKYVPGYGGYLKLHNEYEVIQSITDEPNQTVYGLEVEDYHNYVGDGVLTHNCIYSFRGADSSIIKALIKDPKWTIYRLTENYRSTNSIIEYVNSFSKSYADESYRVELTADKIGVPVYIEVSSATSAYNYGRVELYILDKIIADYEIQTGSSAILARTNAEVKCITNYLKLNDISYTTNSSDEEFINMVRSAISDDYAVMWLSSKLDSVKYTRFLKSTMMDDNYSLMNFRNLFGNYPEISDRLSKILELKETKSPEELFNMLNILINAKQLSVSNNELYVGTIHSVKGLEFDHVYVVDVNSVNFKLDTEENKNLYYVAITRARESLQVFAEAEN